VTAQGQGAPYSVTPLFCNILLRQAGAIDAIVPAFFVLMDSR